MLTARDADHAHPLRSEDEGSEVFDYLRRLEREQAAEENRPRWLLMRLKDGRGSLAVTL